MAGFPHHLSITETYAPFIVVCTGQEGLLSVEAHFDESGTDATEVTVAGYLFEAQRIGTFCGDWNAVLAEQKLDYFHMVECAHGNGQFKGQSRDARIKVQMRFMRLIKRYAVNGIVCNIFNDKQNPAQSYSNAVGKALEEVAKWADCTAFSEKIAYFFEAGAEGQKLANARINEIAADTTLCADHRYVGHTFVPKAGNPGVQAADLLAWQYHNFTKKRSQNNVARLDLRALLRHPHSMHDECGNTPRDSKIQSVENSAHRIETIHYLPTAKPGVEYAELEPTADFTPFSGQVPGTVLACPNCFRAVAEDIPPRQFNNIVIRCWCGTRCLIPPLLAPFARY